MPKPMSMWLAAVLIGSASTTIPVVGFAQPASPPAQLPVTPADQGRAWGNLPVVDPAIVPPGQAPMAPQRTEPTAEQRALAQQQTLQSSVVASQFVQAQVLAQIQAQAAANQQPVQQPEDEDQAEPEPDTSQPAPAPPAASVQAAPISLDAPTSVDARGADGGARITWSLPAAGHANRYALYCDDGTLGTASTPRTVMASDECPSQVAFSAGARPNASWRACAEVAGTDTSAALTGLANGEPMAFALAAIDDSGTVGALSNVSCSIASQNGEYELDDPTPSTAAAETGEGCSASTPGVGTGALVPLGLVGALPSLLAGFGAHEAAAERARREHVERGLRLGQVHRGVVGLRRALGPARQLHQRTVPAEQRFQRFRRELQAQLEPVGP